MYQNYRTFWPLTATPSIQLELKLIGTQFEIWNSRSRKFNYCVILFELSKTEITYFGNYYEFSIEKSTSFFFTPDWKFSAFEPNFIEKYINKIWSRWYFTCKCSWSNFLRRLASKSSFDHIQGVHVQELSIPPRCKKKQVKISLISMGKKQSAAWINIWK